MTQDARPSEDPSQNQDAARQEFDTLLADLSAQFVNVPADRVDREILDAQRRLCEFLDVDRAALWQINAKDPATLNLTHIYQRPGVPPLREQLRAASDFPWTLGEILQGKTVAISNVAQLPAEAARDAETLARLDARSSLVMPLSTGGGPVLGSLTFGSYRREVVWLEPVVKRCRLIAEVFANALARKHADQALRDSERFVRSTLDALGDNIAIIDETGTILNVNRAWLEFAKANDGDPRTTGVGANYLAVCDKARGHDSAIAAEMAAVIRSIIRGEQTEFALEYPCDSPHKKRWFIARVSRFAGDGFVRVVVAHSDITGRRIVEAALVESEERARLAAEAAQLGAYRYDHATGRGWYSAEFLAIYGLGPDETLPLGLDQVPLAVLAEDRDAFLHAMELTNNPDGDGWFRAEFRIQRPDGSIRWLMGCGRTTFVGPPGARRPDRAAGIIMDITDRKRLEEQLLLSQKMDAIGRLAGGVAHDFRNQLTVVKGYAEMLLRRELVNSAGRDAANEILAAARRGIELTSRLLAFGRGELLQPRVVDVCDEVARMLGTLGGLLGEDIAVTVHRSEEECHVNVAVAQFEHVMVNLAINARDAMPAGGKLTIDISRVEIGPQTAKPLADIMPGPYVRIAVTDTGHGMDSGTLKRIFEPFFTTKQSGQGGGLGLAMTYGFVKQSGGFIVVQSEPGKGSTFALHFPRVPRRPEPAPVRAIPERASGDGETILVVEDEAPVRQLLVDNLREAGYNVLQAADAQEAVQMAGHHPHEIHMLISDVIMPNVSGVTLANWIKELRPKIGVLLISGYGGKDLAQHGVKVDRAGLLVKSFTYNDLLAAVRRVFHERA